MLQDKFAEKPQKAAEIKDMKTVYQITKLKGNHGPNQDPPVNAEDGLAIAEEMAKLDEENSLRRF